MQEMIVVVGAGQAAAQLAVSLRRGGFRGGIRIVGDEPYLPYQRPPLSKSFLAAPAQPDSLLLRPESFWRDQEVAFELGTPVAALDVSRGHITLRNGREIPYGSLVLATGTRARTVPIPGIDLPGVFSVRQIDDVRTLRPALDEARRIVIVGGGYIGLEVAAVMRGEGRDVTVVEAEDRVMKRVTGEIASSFFDRVHRERGVDIRLSARLAAIEGDGRASAARLADGTSVAADLMLAATGARANDDLAAAAGLACEDGIIVDEFARTAIANVYAIGDCARFPSRRFGRRLRLECVQNAIDHAKAVAATLLGQPQIYDPVPWYWSDQYDVKLQMAGLMDGHDNALAIGEPAGGRFSIEYRRNGILIAVDAVNDGRAHMLGRRRVAEETARAPVA
jgi:3-phenylpropionate/trans-cinnamate dioxygenase ferredoxin reductase component